MKRTVTVICVVLWCFGPGPAMAEDAPVPEEKPKQNLLHMFGIRKVEDKGKAKGHKTGEEPPCPTEEGKGDGKAEEKGEGIFCPIPGEGNTKPKARPSAKISFGPGAKVEPESSPLAGQVKTVISGHTDDILACYNAGLDNNWELAGRLQIVFSVQPDGTVTDVVIADDTAGDKELVKCVVKVVGTIRFIPPGWLVKVSYPVLFSAIPVEPAKK